MAEKILEQAADTRLGVLKQPGKLQGELDLYMSASAAAKLVRRALKEAFPTVKFSVRTHQCAGGASLRVSWMDGPTAEQVEAVANRFQGTCFDSLQERPANFMVDWIVCERRYSVAFLQRVVDEAFQCYGLAMPRPPIIDAEYGAWVDAGTVKLEEPLEGLWFLEQLIRKVAARTPGDK